MQTSNYRGISLTSVIGKLFERIILKRITQERGIPHYTQTAFQSGISCADPTEVVQEAVRSYIQDGSMALQCFYDLEKAFDSVEYTVFCSTTCSDLVSMGKRGGLSDLSIPIQELKLGLEMVSLRSSILNVVSGKARFYHPCSSYW